MSEAANNLSWNVQNSPRQSTALRRSALIGGGILALLGLSQRSKTGYALAATGGLLAFAGTRMAASQRKFTAHSSMLLNCSPEEAYRFWRDFENLPRFMHHLDSVTVIDNRRSKWTAIGPLNTKITWEAEIVAERQNEMISWRSVQGSNITVDGVVEFSTAPANRGTLITATIIYQPPAASVGRALAKLLGKDPDFLMRQDLRRFKALVETGEIPTVEGQPHGPRSGVTAAARLLDPDNPVSSETNLTEAVTTSRRAS